MKKPNKKSNVIKLNKRTRKRTKRQKQMSERRLALEGLVRDYFTCYDPTPDIDWNLAKDVFEDFRHYCALLGDTIKFAQASPCNIKVFGKLVTPYVERKKSRHGSTMYRLKDTCILSIRANAPSSDDMELTVAA